MTQEQAQASDEALKLARELLTNLPYMYPPCGYCAEGGEQEEFERESRALDITNTNTLALALDRVSRERTQQALERAAALVEDEEGWEPVVVTDKSEGRYRDELDLDATVTRIAAAIRGLSDGESVASEEKEE